MKKALSLLTVLFCICCAAFAEKKVGYSVTKVTGVVTYEVSAGNWADVKAGMILEEDANVNVGLNSTLVVELDGKSFTVKPMKKGLIADLTAANKTGVKVGSKVKKSDIVEDSAKSTKGTATASSRASEAKSDLDWDE